MEDSVPDNEAVLLDLLDDNGPPEEDNGPPEEDDQPPPHLLIQEQDEELPPLPPYDDEDDDVQVSTGRVDEEDDAPVIEFEEDVDGPAMDAAFVCDPRSNKQDPRPTSMDVIIPEVPAASKPVDSAKPSKRVPHLLDEFRHRIGEKIAHRQKRAAFSGFINRLAKPLSFKLPIDDEKLSFFLEKIQPYHMGEAEDSKGPFYQKANFIVDSEGSGFHLPRELVQNITTRYMDYYREKNPLFAQNFITRMSNRIWKFGAAEGDPRTETIVPDSYYFRKFMIRVGVRSNEHTYLVCTELQFSCHPETRNTVMAKRKMKNDQKLQKKKAKRQQLQISGADVPRTRESVDAFWTWKETLDVAVRDQVASIRSQLLPLGPYMLSLGRDWIRYLSSTSTDRALRELQTVSAPVIGIIDDNARRQQLLNLSRLFALVYDDESIAQRGRRSRAAEDEVD